MNESELVDFIVTHDSMQRVAEYERPDEGYEIVVAIPAAFTPVCASELEILEELSKGEIGESLVVVMLENPHSVQAWLKEKKLEQIKVLVSEWATNIYDLKTGYKDRPLSRTMIVTHYQKEAQRNELLRYTTHMDIPRNFDEAIRVIEHHKTNALVS